MYSLAMNGEEIVRVEILEGRFDGDHLFFDLEECVAGRAVYLKFEEAYSTPECPAISYAFEHVDLTNTEDNTYLFAQHVDGWYLRLARECPSD